MCIRDSYKTTNDGISGVFEPVKCHTYITESTFGLPVYNWQEQSVIFDKINNWWNKNQEAGKVSLITAYSLGKAQRILQNVDHSIGTVYTHGAIENTNKVFREYGIPLKPSSYASASGPYKDYQGSFVIAPGSAATSSWSKKFKDFRLGAASGWMNVRGARRRRAADIGFVLSDHADWNQLNESIAATGADEIFVTHGFSEIFSEYLKTQGYDAKVVKTAFEGEQDVVEEDQAA